MRFAVAASVCLAAIAHTAAAAPAPSKQIVDSQQRGSVGENVPAFTVRPGYRVTLAAENLEEARFMQFGEDGQGNSVLYLSQPRRGAIVSLRDTDGDGVFETKADFVTEQSNAHCMDFKDGWLWYTSAKEGFCKKARDTNGDGKADETITVIPADMENGIPDGGGHPFRGILVGRGPDEGKLYITVSDPRNMTAELDSDRKTIYVFQLNEDATRAGNRQVFVTGIRNTEKLQYRPNHNGDITWEIWGADHASDNFGEEYGDDPGDSQPITNLFPPDELNHYVEGGFYGHPYLMAHRVPHPEFVDREDLHELAEKTIDTQWDYPAHSAANGFTFLQSDYFGADHVGDLFQALHGSWNRQGEDGKSGYSVMRVLFDPMTGRPAGQLPIVSCMAPDGEDLARPVDCVEAPDGTILFSSDTTKRIYRISKEQ